MTSNGGKSGNGQDKYCSCTRILTTWFWTPISTSFSISSSIWQKIEGVVNSMVSKMYWTSLPDAKNERILGDFFIPIDDNTSIHLTNLRIVGFPEVRISEISLNMDSINLNLAVNLGTIRLEAQYEVVNLTVARLLPVFNIGKIVFLIDNVQAKGKVSLKSVEDSLVSGVYDLKYTANEFQVQVENPQQGKDIENNLTCNELDKSIVKKFWTQLTHSLNEHIYYEMAEPIVDVSMGEFLGDTEFAHELNRYSKDLSGKVNYMVDAVLDKARAALGQQIATAGMSAVFTRKSPQRRQTTLRETGVFVASGGQLSSVNTLRQKTRFRHGSSYVMQDQNGDISIIAALEFAELKLHYDHYSITIDKLLAQGSLTLNIESNFAVLKFKLIPQADNKYKPEFQEFQIQNLSGCSLDILELGALDSLTPQITTWAVGTMWGKIIPKIETDVTKALKTSIDNIIFHSEVK